MVNHPNRSKASTAEISQLALKIPLPWLNGEITAAEWCEAVDIVQAAAGKSLLRAPSAAPAVDLHKPTPRGFKPQGMA